MSSTGAEYPCVRIHVRSKQEVIPYENFSTIVKIQSLVDPPFKTSKWHTETNNHLLSHPATSDTIAKGRTTQLPQKLYK